MEMQIEKSMKYIFMNTMYVFWHLRLAELKKNKHLSFKTGWIQIKKKIKIKIK